MRLLLLIPALLATPASAQDGGDATSRVMTATSLDGRQRADIYPMRPVACQPDGAGATLNAQHVLTVTDIPSGRKSIVLMGDRFGRDRWHDATVFGRPKFSPDGRRVYVVARDTLCETDTWNDSPGIFWTDSQQDGDLRPPHFVAHGRLVGIVRDGPRAGYLLVERRAARGRDPVVLLTPAGGLVTTIPGSERSGKAAVGPWLRAWGWTSY